MANAVFTTKPASIYDDLPELRYHFPKQYLKTASLTVGDWIVYYEPRREGLDDSGVPGRQSYFATALVERIEPHGNLPDHYYCYIKNYLEFDIPVPFRRGRAFFESALKKPDESTNRGTFRRSVRPISVDEYSAIVRAGFLDPAIADVEHQDAVVAESDPQIAQRTKSKLVQRPFRDAAFARTIQKAYKNTCAITGLQLVNGGGRCEIEAAHIRPVANDELQRDRSSVEKRLDRSM